MSYSAARISAETLLRLKVIAEPDSSVLVRVLHALQARNVVPQRVHAERVKVWKTGSEIPSINIEIATTDIDPRALQAIAGKIDQFPLVSHRRRQRLTAGQRHAAKAPKKD